MSARVRKWIAAVALAGCSDSINDQEASNASECVTPEESAQDSLGGQEDTACEVYCGQWAECAGEPIEQCVCPDTLTLECAECIASSPCSESSACASPCWE